MFFTSYLEHYLLKTVGKVLALPVTAPYQSGKWMLERIHEQVVEEQESEDRVMTHLTELQLAYELGEIEEEEYRKQEKALMEDLSAIRAAKRDEEYEPSQSWWSKVFGGD